MKNNLLLVYSVIGASATMLGGCTNTEVGTATGGAVGAGIG